MTTRPSLSVVCALGFAFATAPAFSAHAQTAVDTSTNAPAAPAVTIPVVPAPADTNAASATAPTERPATYTLVSGDTLDSIAKKFGTSIRALAKLNNIDKSQYKKLQPGQVIKIPPATPSSTTNK
jgi:LysM repeat protein